MNNTVTTNNIEITVRCVLKLASVGAWFAGSAYILNHHRDDPEALVNLVTKVVLPSGIVVRCIVGGSVKIVLWTTDLNALRELWKRYKSGQLRKDLEKVLVTEYLKNLSNGEEIEFGVEMNESEYRNACLDLVVAYHEATRKVTACLSRPRRSLSLPDMTSISIQPMPIRSEIQEIRRNALKGACSSKPKRLCELRAGSSASSGHFSTSVSSETDDRHVFLSDFLQMSNTVQDICGILDREMILCHDWRSVASEFGYKMNDIRLLERKQSPCMALLEDIALKSPDIRLSELIDKLSYLEREDIVYQIEGHECNSDPKALVNLPFIVRKKISLELDYATLSQFTDVVRNVADISSGEIAALQKRPSPTMALLEELETVYPSLDISHLSKACRMGKVGDAAEILDGYIKTFLRREKVGIKSVKKKESLKRLTQIGGDSGLGSVQSPTEEMPRPRFPLEKSLTIL